MTFKNLALILYTCNNPHIRLNHQDTNISFFIPSLSTSLWYKRSHTVTTSTRSRMNRLLLRLSMERSLSSILTTPPSDHPCQSTLGNLCKFFFLPIEINFFIHPFPASLYVDDIKIIYYDLSLFDRFVLEM